VLLFAVCLLPTEAWVQPVLFQHITTEEGLSQNSVVSIAQDSFGFMYFAAQDGLNRYDGSSITAYEAYFKDDTKSAYSQLGRIFIDSHNRMWSCMKNGALTLWSAERDTFSTIIGISDASYIMEYESGKYYVGSFSEGLYELKFSDITDYEVVNRASGFGVYQIHLRNSGGMLLATTSGVKIYDGYISEVFPLLSNMHISDIIEWKDELLISTFSHGLYSSSNMNDVYQYADLPKDLRIQDIHSDSKSRLWIATYSDGLFKIENGYVSRFINDPLDHKSINYNDILTIFEDHQENMWFGSDGGGTSYVKSYAKPIYSVTSAMLRFEAEVDVPRAISTDRDRKIWIGTSGKGLTAVMPDLSEIVHYSSSAEHEVFRIPIDRIMSLLHDESDNLWIGTQEGGLLYKSADQPKIISINQDILKGSTIWDIHLADADHLWLCTRSRGLLLYHVATGQVEMYNSDSGHIDDNNIRTIINGEVAGEFICGSENGIITVIDYPTRQFTKLELGQQMISSVKSLCSMKEQLWIGTSQHGIVIYDRSNSDSYVLNHANGLPNNMVYSIIPHNEYVWITTNKGVAQIYRDFLRPNVLNQIFSTSDGLVSKEYNTGAYHIDDRGTLYFGGLDGVNWFDPNKMLKDLRPVQLSLLEIIITRSIGQDHIPIYDKAEIELSYKDRDFQVKYSTLEFTNVEEREYLYQLVGLNKDWINNGSSELVNFSNVPPGDYQFLLKSKNHDGVWNRVPIQIAIHIEPAVWQTLWFRLLVVATVVYAIWHTYRMRLNQIRATADLQNQLAKSEAKALKSQMNPHFLFNSLNAIDHYILNNDKATASIYLTKFSKLIRCILDFSDVPLISLDQELEILELYVMMEQLRFPRKFEFKFTVDSLSNTQMIKIPPLILQPFVENAIWHGLLFLNEPGFLSITVSKNKRDIICTIDDNGIGRLKSAQLRTAKSTKRKSHGISITKERLRLNNQLFNLGGRIDIIDKYDIDGKATGTQVLVTLPHDNFITKASMHEAS